MAKKKSKTRTKARTAAKSKARVKAPKARATAGRAKAKRRAGGARAQSKRRPPARTKAAGRKTRRAGAPSTGRRGAAKPARAPAPAPDVPAAPSITALPSIEVETTGGRQFRLSDLKGRNVVLYFYPKDDTPGCTTEGCEIRDRYDEFQRHDTVVYGVSRDGVASHERFKAKYGFPFELIADPDEKLCRAFGVMREKSLYGRTYLGVDRSTFVFDKAGLLRKTFRGVKVPGHADQVLEELRRL